MMVWAATLLSSFAQTVQTPGEPLEESFNPAVGEGHPEVFEAPEAGDGVRLGSLVVVKRTEEFEGERDRSDPLQVGNVRIVPRLGEPVVKAVGNKLMLFTIVYPDRRLPYEPRLGVEFSRAGRVIGATQPRLPSDRNEEGDIPFIITFTLDYFDPGDYQVRVVAQQGDTYAESRTEFKVVAP